MAKLYFRHGVVKSVKTTLLLGIRDGYIRQNKRVLLWKPKQDTRDGQRCVSRLGLSNRVDMEILPWSCEFLVAAVCGQNHHEIKLVLIDEAQFLTRKNVEGLRRIASQLDIPVICYGLRTDWMGQLFPGSAALFCLADTIEEVKMVCWHDECNRKAVFNEYLGDKNSNDQVIIGHDFIGVCAYHWSGYAPFDILPEHFENLEPCGPSNANLKYVYGHDMAAEGAKSETHPPQT